MLDKLLEKKSNIGVMKMNSRFNKSIVLLFLMVLLPPFLISCKEEVEKKLSAQEIIDKSIEICGGALYSKSNITFRFRDKLYELSVQDSGRILKRIIDTGRVKYVDIMAPSGFTRLINDSLAKLPDSLIDRYANAVNSVHYFAYLPFGLNDPAVNKTLLGEVIIKNKDYYKIKVLFDKEGGGDDYEDTYIYWFNKNTFKPDYLAYEFHVNDGGMRFREAYNERYINGIRFVDYYNYEPMDSVAITIGMTDSLFINKKLKLLSKIELEDITVSQDNYN